MPQFDVYELGLTAAPYVVDIQSDLLSDLGTRVVIPLVMFNPEPHRHMKGLHPNIEIDGVAYTLRTSEIAAVAATRLKKKMARLDDNQRLAVIRAVDFLMDGV
jgi:toxin CcdB